MIDITIVIIGIVGLFAIFVALRTLFSLQVCALCAAVVASWMIFLVFLYAGSRIDPMLIGILMGGSVVGVMYLLEKKFSERYHLFKLPFFLTLFSVTYFVLEKKVMYRVVWMLVALWILVGVVYVGRHTPTLKTLGKKLIECCKNW